MALWISSEMRELLEDLDSGKISIDNLFPTNARAFRPADKRPNGQEQIMYSKNNGYNKSNTSGYKAAGAKPDTRKERSTTIGASLSFGVKNNDKVEFVDVAPLFTEQDKNGADYYSITLKEELTIPAGAKLYVRPRASK